MMHQLNAKTSITIATDADVFDLKGILFKL